MQQINRQRKAAYEHEKMQHGIAWIQRRKRRTSGRIEVFFQGRFYKETAESGEQRKKVDSRIEANMAKSQWEEIWDRNGNPFK